MTSPNPVGAVTRFTPGPWTVEQYGDSESLVIHSSDVNRVCFMANAGVLGDPFEIKANAHLIAAAPELYDALKIARECIAYCRRTHKDAQSGDGFPVEIILDAALSKARGETP